MALLTTLKEYSKQESFSEEYLSIIKEKYSNNSFEEGIIKEIGKKAFSFISKYVNVTVHDNFFTSTTTRFNIKNLPAHTYRNIINIKKINDARYVNKFFEAVNSKLEHGGLYINCVETYATRRHRVLNKFIRPFNWLYYMADVIFMRIFPKLPITKQIYFFITRGVNRVLTRAETFGRLYSCGFEIVDEATIDNKLYFVARKIKAPVFDDKPSYGLLISLKRVGKGGKFIKAYKLRTMHAYSEYLQQYVYEKNGTSNGDKANNDFRVTPQGRILRKFWIDELPMLINLLKGEIKIVGVRPISEHKFKMYPKSAQIKRIKFKPGLVPPFYVDLPSNFEDLVASEMRYLEAYEKHPFRTDIAYFFKAFYNIFFKGARSS